jgi:hypothetical protein
MNEGLLLRKGMQGGLRLFRLLPNALMVQPPTVVDSRKANEMRVAIRARNRLKHGAAVGAVPERSGGQLELANLTNVEERLVEDQAAASAELAVEAALLDAATVAARTRASIEEAAAKAATGADSGAVQRGSTPPAAEPELAWQASSPPNLQSLQNLPGKQVARELAPEARRTRACAEFELNTNDNSSNSNSGAGARGNGSAPPAPAGYRPSTDQVNWLLEQLEELDSAELNEVLFNPANGQRGPWRRYCWQKRIRQEFHAVDRAIGMVQETMRHQVMDKPIGKVFVEARKIVEAAGRKLP